MDALIESRLRSALLEIRAQFCADVFALTLIVYI